MIGSVTWLCPMGAAAFGGGSLLGGGATSRGSETVLSRDRVENHPSRPLVLPETE
jgi:hypothetical protein